MISPTLLALIIVAGEWTGLARAALGSPVYAGALDLLLIALAAGTVIAHRRSLPRPCPLDLLIGSFFVIALVEMFNPNVPSLLVGAEGFRKTAFTMLGYFVIRVSTNEDPIRFFAIVAGGSLFAIAFALRQFVAPVALDLAIISSSGASPIGFHAGPILRAFSPMAGPFHLGITASSVAYMASALSRYRSRRWIVVMVIAALGLLASLTRANILATIVGGMVIVACILAARKLSPVARRRTQYVLVVSGIAFAVAVLALTFGMIDLAGILGNLPVVGADRSFRFRLKFWSDFSQAVAQSPIIGYGTSSATDGFDRLFAGTGSVNFEPHSIYFKSALELGIDGLVLTLAILLLAARHALRVLRTEPVLGSVGIGVLSVLAISGLSGPMLDAYPYNLLFWSIVGWLATIDQRRNGSAVARRPSREQHLHEARNATVDVQP